ncbi:MAG: hypothetical protein SGJ05_12465 [bacterium]|nr:hypothetical protein [bacterium]
MPIRTLSIFVTLLVACLVFSCSSDPVGPEDITDMQAIDTVVVEGRVLEVYATAPVISGYNGVALRVLENGEVVRNASLRITPRFDLGTFHSSCPVIQPAGADGRGLYASEIFFYMASDSAWSLNIDMVRDNQILYSFTVPVRVTSSPNAKLRKGADGIQWIVALDPNHSRVNVHQRISDMQFAIADDVKATISTTVGTTETPLASNLVIDSRGWCTSPVPLPSGPLTINVDLQRDSSTIGRVLFVRE